MEEKEFKEWRYAVGELIAAVLNYQLSLENLRLFLFNQLKNERTPEWECSDTETTEKLVQAVKDVWEIRRGIPSQKLGQIGKMALIHLIHFTMKHGQVTTESISVLLNISMRKIKIRAKKGLPNTPVEKMFELIV